MGEHSGTLSLVQMWDSGKPSCIIHAVLGGKVGWNGRCWGSARFVDGWDELRSHKFSLEHRQSSSSFSPGKRVLSVSICLILSAFLYPLSVHARLCQPVVHDAEGAHPSWEPVLTGTGAGLTRVPDGHLRKLLLHNRQIHLQGRERKEINRCGNTVIGP